MYTILSIDDEPELLQLGKLFLESTGDFSVETALSGAEGLEQLAHGRFDAVVSDYQMPEMNGIEFLKSVRKTWGNIPFILFTGKGREEVVIEAINNGADFYLQKGGDPRAQFAELAHKIRQAVNRRRAELALSDSERRLADIINFLPDATLAIDTNGKVIAWNRAIEEMTGIPADQVLGKGNYEYALPFYGKRRPILIDLIGKPDEVTTTYYSDIRHDGNSISAETNLATAKGRQIYVLAKATPLYNNDGEITGAIETIRDISDRKKSEEDLRAANEQLATSGEELRVQYDELAEGARQIRERESRMRYIIGFYESSWKSEKELLDYAVEGSGIVTGSPLGYLAFLSDDESELSMYAWTKSAMQECTMREKPIIYKTEHTGLWGEAVRQRRAIITNDYEAPNPKKKGCPKGHPRIIRHMNVPVIDDGHVVVVAGVANKPSDYTESDTYELELLIQALWTIIKRKRAEQTRQETDEKYRKMVEQSPVGMHFFELKEDGSLILTGANPGADALLGISHRTIIGKTIEEAFPEITSKTDAPVKYRKIAEEGGIWQTEMAFYGEGGGIGRAFAVSVFRISPGNIVIMFTDITGRKQMETELHAAYEQVASAEEELRMQYNDLARAQEELTRRQQQLEEIAATVPGVVYQFTVYPDGRRALTYTNAKTAQQLFGLGAEHGDLFLQLAEHIHPGDRQRFEASIDEVIEKKEGWNFEGRFIKPSGELIWFQGLSNPAQHEKALVYSGVLLDITARKKTERDLRESEERYRLITENSPDMVYFVDPDGYIRYINAQAARVLDANPGNLTGKHITEICDQESANRYLNAFKKVINTKIPVRKELIEKLPVGKFWMDVRLNPVIDETNQVIGVLGLSHDISDRKKAEEALQESETKYRLLVNNSYDIIYTISPGGTLTYASPSWTRYLGHETRSVEGMPFECFVHPADVPACESLLAKTALSGEGVSGIEFRVIHANGSIRSYSSTLSPVLDEKGNVISLVGTAHDITDIKQTQNAIRESNRKLNLLSSVTRHDVANQLTVVQGYTQLAKLRHPEPVVADFLDKITAALDIIQHQIEFTRTYQDLGVQAPAWFNIGDIIRSVKPPGIALDISCESCEIFADPMIGKVFFNLFENAVQYGERVTTINVRCENSGDSRIITFEDDGIGIPPEEKQKIFGKGYGRHTGFGLFLVREILAITGITIQETGNFGNGARFEMAIPKGAYRKTP